MPQADLPTSGGTVGRAVEAMKLRVDSDVPNSTVTWNIEVRAFDRDIFNIYP